MNSTPKHINALVRAEVRRLDAYYVPPAEKLVKLDAMENPYSLPAKLRGAWLARIKEVKFNRYPDPRCQALKALIRATFGIADADGLVLGNGSDELLQMLALLVGGPGRVILAPTPTFAMYRSISVASGSEFVGVPLGADFHLDGDALLDAMARHQPACVFLAYPNNPTGNCFDEGVIEEVLARAPGVVVVDEAYFAFCRRSFLSRLGQFPDLMVLRTLSKSGMAGLRLGMLIAHPQWTAQLEKVRLPYNISSLTQSSAAFCLEHHEIMQQQADRILAERKAMFARLATQPGVHPYPSDANFLLFKVHRDAEQIHTRLKERGVLIKNLHRPATPLENCLRVTIGTKLENPRFLNALANSMN